MPYTEKQRRLFHELAENPEARKRHGVTEKEAKELADEADDFARKGKEKSANFIDLSQLW